DRYDGNSVLEVAGVIAGIALPKRLAISVDRAQGDRRAAAGSEDGSHSPAAQQMSHETGLGFVPGHLVNRVEVIDKCAIEGLHAVTSPQVERIRWSNSGVGLSSSAGTKRLRPSEVRHHGHAVPVRCFHRYEKSVVIAIAHGGVQADSRGQLTVCAE